MQSIEEDAAIGMQNGGAILSSIDGTAEYPPANPSATC